MKTGRLGSLFLFLSLMVTFLFAKFVYTPLYELETRFVVKDSQQEYSLGIAAALMGTGVSEQQQKLYILRDYILSQEMLLKLVSRLQLDDSFQSEQVFFMQRLHSDASASEMLDYYRSLMSVEVDIEASIIILKIQGYQADLLYQQCSVILEFAESFINGISRELAVEQAEKASEYLRVSYDDLTESQLSIVDFQNENHIFLPDNDAALQEEVLAGLEIRRVTLRAKLNALRDYYNPEAYELQVLQSEINAMNKEVEAKYSELVGETAGRADTALNSKISEFRKLKMDFELATQVYAQAYQSLQQTQISATQNLSSLVTVSSAVVPSRPSYPRVWLWLLSVSIGGFVALKIVNVLRLALLS